LPCHSKECGNGQPALTLAATQPETKGNPPSITELAAKVYRSTLGNPSGNPAATGGVAEGGCRPPLKMTSGNPPSTTSKSVLLRRAGDMAEQIREHVAGCRHCLPAEAFSVAVRPLGCCAVGGRLWGEYRQVRRRALGVRHG
jgi:hypothetical protein